MSKVNVTECRYYNCGECFAEPQTGYCGEFRGYGKCDNRDCYYKQLQQLKAEIELYKNQSPLATKAFVTSYKSYKKQAEDNYELWQKAEKCLDDIKELLVVDGCIKCPYSENVVKKCKRNIEPCVLRLKGNILRLIKQAKEGGE